MRGCPVEIEEKLFVEAFIYPHSLCMREVKALTRRASVFNALLCDELNFLMNWLEC